jgi:3-hydroxyisobutyrate dehydrogenase-like beta-hydroxyacid dehydrogenase
MNKPCVELLTATATLKQFQSAIAQGHGEKDIAAVVETFRKN